MEQRLINNSKNNYSRIITGLQQANSGSDTTQCTNYHAILLHTATPLESLLLVSVSQGKDIYHHYQSHDNTPANSEPAIPESQRRHTES